MGVLSPTTRQRQAQLASAIGNHRGTPEEIAELRQAFNAAALADYLASRLSASPMLTTRQYDELHAVIRRHRFTTPAR